MARTATKSVALTVAAGVLTFGVQELTAGDTATGAAAFVVGGVLFAGYQLAENADHTRSYDDIVAAIGEDTFERLSESSADAIGDRSDGLTDDYDKWVAEDGPDPGTDTGTGTDSSTSTNATADNQRDENGR